MPQTLPVTCVGCPLYDAKKTFVPPTGSGRNQILIVAEAPGEQEALSGVPFSGAAGKQLEHLLKLAGLNRDDFAIDNVLHCRPPHNELRGASYEFEAIRHCRKHLDDTIAKYNPKVILALGNTPMERLTGLSGITRYRGYPVKVGNVWVVPTYHPSFLLPRRGQKSTSHLTPAVIRDIKLALAIAKDGYQREEPVYLEDPPTWRARQFYEEWVNAGFPDLSIDIETPYKLESHDEEGFDELDTQILRIGYCFKPGYAMSIPYTPEYMSIHEDFLGSPLGRKIWWNGYHFDVPIIKSVGLDVAGEQIDAMWGWHYLQPDLPRGLESVGSFFFNGLPWKHLSKENPARYNAIDVDCALQNWIGIEKGLRSKNQWEGFQEFVVDLDPILQEAGTNGVFIDRRARRKLYKTLRREENAILRAIQPLVPKELRPKKRYKKWPKTHDGNREILSVIVPGFTKRCDACGATGVSKASHAGKKGGRNGESVNPCYKAPISKVEADVAEFDVVMDFNPLSSDQLIGYCQFVGHPIGKHPKTGSPTVDDDHLETLIKKFGKDYPIYEHIQNLRTISKSISTYVRGLKPNADGVVQTQYSYTPATGRLSSKGLQRGQDRGVNLQNIPHRGDHPYASDIRRMIVPRDGYVFVEADSSAIEAVIVGWCMKYMHIQGGEDYIKMAQRGVHDAFSLYELNKPLTDENIAWFKKAAKVHGSPEHIMRDRKKRTVHAVSYDEGPGLITKQYPESFPTFMDAKKEVAAFHRFVPGLKVWHHKTRVEAHENTFIQLPFGNYRRYFYDVFTYKRDFQGKIETKDNGMPAIKLGEDGKSCIAQRPQGIAALFMRQNALRIAREVKQRKLDFHLPGNYLVHDSYCLEVPNNPKDIEVARELLVRHLTRKIPELNGLQIGCEVKVGKDWDDMETLEVVKI